MEIRHARAATVHVAKPLVISLPAVLRPHLALHSIMTSAVPQVSLWFAHDYIFESRVAY